MAFPISEEAFGEDATGDILIGNDGAYFVFRNIDLAGIRSFTAQIGTMAEMTTGGRLDIRAGGVDGEVLGAFEVPQGGSGLQTYEAVLDAASGMTDLYFVFVAPERGGGSSPVSFVDWIVAQQ